MIRGSPMVWTSTTISHSTIAGAVEKLGMPTSHRCGGKALLILCVLKKTWNYLNKIQKPAKYHKQG